MQKGTKFDGMKPRWSLLPKNSIVQIVGVLEFGATKYAENNWQHVKNGKQRYYDAMMRHIDAWWSGDKKDPESGLSHLAHAGCCLLFLLWFDNETDKLKQLDEGC